MSKGIFVFRRDLRGVDNISLIALSHVVDFVVPVFILSPTQISNTQNKFKSHNAVKFMVDSLLELNATALSGKLNVFHGEPVEVLRELLRSDSSITHIAFNRDYTKYAMERDAAIAKLPATIISKDDCLIFPLHSVVTGSGTVYKKYTPFLRKALKRAIPPVNKTTVAKQRFLSFPQSKHSINPEEMHRFYDTDQLSPQPAVKGGRKAGLKLLQRAKGLSDYDEKRNNLTYKTSLLSAYNKFGCLSIREVAHALKGIEGLYAQLIWREFFYNLGAKHPEIFNSGHNGVVNRKVTWKRNSRQFKNWSEGQTGVAVVDAAMRQLNTTGYMHNRGRLIVSNYLTRTLELDWHLGERYFAQKLIDYDPIQNSFGWQISVNLSGTESRPLAQTKMNPERQTKRFDPTGEFRSLYL